MWNDSELSGLDKEYANSWKNLAAPLGVEVASPFVIEKNNKEYIFAFCIKQFGTEETRNGVVGRVEGEEFSPEQCGEIWEVAVENGYSPHNQAKGAISLTIDDAKQYLNMYKWYGPEASKPKWHTGELYDELWKNK
jgi:hypothetical protein